MTSKDVTEKQPDVTSTYTVHASIPGHEYSYVRELGSKGEHLDVGKEGIHKQHLTIPSNEQADR